MTAGKVRVGAGPRAGRGPIPGLPRLRNEKAHSNNDKPGSAESGPTTITMDLFRPVGPIFGHTGPNISIVRVFNRNRARPGPLLLLCTFCYV